MRRRFHELVESLYIAVGAMRANKVRGVLTTLGIVIGITGVVTTMTAANGLTNSFKESVAVLGSDVLYVSRAPWIITGDFFEFRNRPHLSLKEGDQLALKLPAARAINPTSGTRRNVKFRSEVLESVDIVGTTDKHVQVSTALPAFGRFLTAFDVRYRRHVCVIGITIHEKLFETVDPLNKQIKIGRHKCRVVGIMEKQGGAGFFGGPDFDSQIYVPISTFVSDFGGTNRDMNLAVKAPDGQALDEFEYAVIGEMRKIRKLEPTEKDNFSVNKMDSLVAMFNNVIGVVLLIGVLITGISLLVGGIGVANILFVSVTERTREIGIRKALGARRATILWQFMLESVIICLIGGLIGLTLSLGITELIARMLMPASVSGLIMTIALVVSVLVGMISGFFPAYRASRLNPIEALRYE